ncbi:MAG: hypothetical protein HY508_02860, partial [Acidobacteria bacterium]|nr:hypothetical protein [Acidobacteriota bacterium]
LDFVEVRRRFGQLSYFLFRDLQELNVALKQLYNETFDKIGWGVLLKAGDKISDLLRYLTAFALETATTPAVPGDIPLLRNAHSLGSQSRF